MKWIAYVYNPKTKTTAKREYEIPGTSYSDTAFATQHVAQKLGVPQDRVLCTPKR